MPKVLVIDDDETIREIFEVFLKKAGYEVRMLEGGDTLLGQEFEEPDIFIIDKQLRGVDGLDICRYLKQRQQHAATPVIIVSASNKVEQPARDAGADAFLSKPFKSKKLLELLLKSIVV
jgi:CheY-like chemotaxis protein